MADDFDEEVELDLDDDVVEEDDDLVLEDDADADLDEAIVEVVDLDVVADPAVPVTKAKAAGDGGGEDTEDEDDENLDLEEELHPDDVEEPLDVLLAERTAAERIDEEEADLEDEELEPEDRAEGGGKIVPRRDDEFLCRSCFLVKPLSQLAKGEKDLCRDCE